VPAHEHDIAGLCGSFSAAVRLPKSRPSSRASLPPISRIFAYTFFAFALTKRVIRTQAAPEQDTPKRKFLPGDRELLPMPFDYKRDLGRRFYETTHGSRRAVKVIFKAGG
jgi:hypothetical protein